MKATKCLSFVKWLEVESRFAPSLRAFTAMVIYYTNCRNRSNCRVVKIEPMNLFRQQEISGVQTREAIKPPSLHVHFYYKTHQLGQITSYR